MNENMVVRPVSPAPPESQGNMKEVGPQALAPRLAAILPACTGAAEFGARHHLSPHFEAARWSGASPRNPDMRDGRVVHALIAAELRRFVGMDVASFDALQLSGLSKAVVTACVDRVKARYMAEQARGTHPVLLVEPRVDCLATWGLAGTCVGYCDCAIVTDDTIHVYEYKFGTGPIYYPQAINQCRIYGLGLISEYGVRRNIVLELMKPGRNFYRRVETTPDELLRWAEETLVPLVRSVLRGERTYRPGPYCNICPGRPLCRAWVTQRIAALDNRFGGMSKVSPQQAPRLSEQEVAELLIMAKDIESCQHPLEEWGVDHVKRGGTIPGFRLDHNPGQLRYCDEAAVTRILQENGLWPKAQKLRTPLELGRAIGDEAFRSLLSGYTYRTPGKDVLRRDDTIVGGAAQ